MTVMAFVFLFNNGVDAQVYLGVTAGPNFGKCTFENETYKNYHESAWAPGFTGGLVLNIEKERKYGLTIQFLYSSKGRIINSSANDYEKNRASYGYLDFPALFRWYFNQGHSRWYLNAGPEINWWISGKGYVDVYNAERKDMITYDYKINLHGTNSSFEYMNVTDPNRVQVSVGVGGGFQWELNDAGYIGVDLRASLGQSFWGPYNGGEIPQIAIKDNFEYNNNMFIFSVVYVIDPIGKRRPGRKEN
jgi:hypothetical protein